MRRSSWFVLAISVGLCTPAAAERTITRDERVKAQEAIERVRLRHLTPAPRIPEPSVLRTVATEKVATYLGETAALDRQWGTVVTAAMLRTETERIARDSQQPDRLRELYDALGDDPVLFQECVARATLVDRLVRTRYAFDSSLHASARARAESARNDMVHGRTVRGLRDGDLSELLLIREGKHDAAYDLVEPHRPVNPKSPRVVLTSKDDLDRVRMRLSAPDTERAEIEETRESFVVRYPLSDGPDGVRLAIAYIRKDSFDSWWRKIRDSISTAAVSTVASPDLPPAMPASRTIAGGTATCENDQWRRTALSGPPDARSYHTAIWTGTEMVVWGGVVGGDFYDGVPIDTGARYDPATDSWTPISRVGAPSPRSRHVAVWTGREMIVWGGFGQRFESCGDGARYDPVTDRWTPMGLLDGPTPTPRYGHTAVWTGSQMLVWGGEGQDGYSLQGGRYDPDENAWSPLPLEDSPSPRVAHTAVWTGSEMIVWGGVNTVGTLLNDGARYDPARDRWNPVHSEAGFPTKAGHTAVWTGTHMIVWGGSGSNGASHLGLSYDPVADDWGVIADAGENNARLRHVAIWTGSRMIVMGGDPVYSRYNSYANEYDPLLDSWRFIPWPSVDIGHMYESVVWTGHEMIVWGGSSGSAQSTNVGARYDPDRRSWTPVSGYDAPIARLRGTSVWTGRELIFWGGDPGGYGYPAAIGERFDATLGTWTAVSEDGAPERRDSHVATWTGTEMIVWGGQSDYYSLATGARYDPLTDSWTPMSILDAPAARYSAVSVWTGSEMLVWGGGVFGGPTATGGRYDPVADVWRPMSVLSAPESRFRPGAVLASGRMIVWGGVGASYEDLNNGGSYDPTTDAWTPMDTTTAPSGRAGFAMVTAGQRVIVWGGGQDTPSPTGAVYDPSIDRWTPMTPSGAPRARFNPSVVWTGDEMIVWGGWDNSDPGYYNGDYLDTGGRYDPATDTWRPTSMSGAPLARSSAAAAWTGSEMLLWGGLANLALSSGGAYVACTPDHPPVADAGRGSTIECTDTSGAMGILDGSMSSDPDSTSGTHDDIVSFEWSEHGDLIAVGEQASARFALGAHDVTLTVTDRRGMHASDVTHFVVRDRLPPVGAVTGPQDGSCFGPAQLPVVVTDDFDDACDAAPTRSYTPSGGPAYSDHGDHDVIVTVRDSSGRAAHGERRFTIDNVPPTATLIAPNGTSPPLSMALPLPIVLTSADDDGATGDVVHESIWLAGCLAYDGATFGNRDGLLHDESISLTRGELCRIAASCGVAEFDEPELRVVATDCGGNAGSASTPVHGRVVLSPWVCSGGLGHRGKAPIRDEAPLHLNR